MRFVTSSLQTIFTLPAYNPRRARLFALTVGIMVFLWLGIEDNSVFPAAVMSLLSTVTMLALWLSRKLGGKTLSARRLLSGAALVGALGGLGTSAAGAALMLFKNGVHSHVHPDYPLGLIVEILQRAPLWALAGSLTGLGLALAVWALRNTSGTSQ